MKRYVTPTLEVQELLQEEALAAVIRSEPTVEDDDLSV
jgi:hypothetical protein